MVELRLTIITIVRNTQKSVQRHNTYILLELMGEMPDLVLCEIPNCPSTIIHVLRVFPSDLFRWLKRQEIGGTISMKLMQNRRFAVMKGGHDLEQ